MMQGNASQPDQIRLRRIRNELIQITRDTDGIRDSTNGLMQVVVIAEEEVRDHVEYKFQGVFQGPPNTPYEDGIFTVDVILPRDYPFISPKMRFVDSLWHPNIDVVSGEIGLTVLRDDWNSQWTLQSLFLALWSVFDSPLTSGQALNLDAKLQLEHNKKEFDKTARLWSISSTGVTENNRGLLLDKFESAGIARDAILSILESEGWNEKAAIQIMFGWRFQA